MKIVINNCFGGWDVPRPWIDKFGLSADAEFWPTKEDRTNANLIRYVESDEYQKTLEEDDDTPCELVVIEIPDEATDFHVTEYDGAEQVYYVVNGKIYVA